MKNIILAFLLVSLNTYCQVDYESEIIFQESDNQFNITSLEKGDLDGDGDIDLISSSFNRVVSFENIDSQGNFSKQKILYTNYSDSINKVICLDIDRDNDLDVIIVNNSNIIALLNINNTFEFEQKELINSGSANNYSNVHFYDMDSDNDLDLLKGRRWYENINENEVTFNTPSNLIKSDEQNSLETIVSTVIYDIDDNGYIDMIITHSYGGYGDGTVTLFKDINNLSNTESISQEIIQHDEGISSTQLIDFNNDNYIDIVITDNAASYYLENLGDEQGFQISTKIWGKNILFDDTDKDGDLDIIGSVNANGLFWAENVDGSGVFNSSNYNYLDLNRRNGDYLITYSDINGDGNNDIIMTAGTYEILGWYEALDASGNFSSMKILSKQDENIAISSHITDIDSDGNVDIITGHYDDGIILHKNYNNKIARRVIKTSSFDRTFQIRSGDINNDGSKDIVIDSEKTATALSWFNNDNLEFSEEKIIYNQSSSRNFELADLDNDNSLDILIPTSGKILWLKNQNNGDNFLTKDAFGNIDGQWFKAITKDMDNDGDLDIIAASTPHSLSDTNDVIAWFENIDGLGNFNNFNLIKDNIIDIQDFAVDDIDKDGDLDIFLIAKEEPKISWFENLGNNSYSEQQLITNDITNPSSIRIVDIDKDNENDLIIGSFFKLGWFKNDGQGNFDVEREINTSGSGSPTSLSTFINSDGDIDLFYQKTRFKNDNGHYYFNSQLLWAKSIENETLTSNNYNEEIVKKDYIVYPNPTSDGIIKLNKEYHNLILYNSYGQKQDIKLNEETINLGNLTKGIYFLRIEYNNIFSTKKVIKL